MDAEEIRLLLKDQATAQVTMLYAELQATCTLIQSHQGGGDLGSPIPCSMRLDVLKFSGNDPNSWIFSINEYFSLLAMSVDQRRDFWRVYEIVLDDASMKILKGRYPNCYKRERLLRLKPSLQRELLVAKPTSLGDAFSLARGMEARLKDQGVTPPTSISAVSSGSQTLTKTTSRLPQLD
ncbi:hypothetical protein Tco_0920517 [Tanacetum coccineum]